MSSPLTVIYEFERFRLDRGNQRLTRDGILVPTPGKTLSILLDLMEHREDVVSLEKLAVGHFPRSEFAEEEVTSEVLKLKRLLDDTSKQAPIIRFVQGGGYRFEAEVTEYLGDAAKDPKFGRDVDDVREPVFDSVPTKPKSKNGQIAIAVTALLAVALAIGVWKFLPVQASDSSSSPGTGGPPQIAVLPFQSLTGQAADDSFNKSIAQQIIASLSKQTQVQVVPESVVQQYVKSGVSGPVSAGQQMGAGLIVRGMAQRLAGRVLVKIQLVNAQDGSQIWSSEFQGQENDLAGLAAQISEKIVGSQAASEKAEQQ